MVDRHEISRKHILSMETYATERRDRRREAVAMKRNRRMEVGPVAAFYFENYDTMWHQLHEMLYIERGGEKHFAIGDCAKADYQAAFDIDGGISFKKKLIKPVLDSSEFDKEIEAIASAIAERRNKK